MEKALIFVWLLGMIAGITAEEKARLMP